MTFEKFENRVVIEAKLVAETPIFIGARADSFMPGAINGACVKDSFGKPYIPGSSLKGVLRAFLAAVENEPLKNEKDNSVVEENFGTKEERDKHKGKELAEKIYEKSTIVERLFGSKVMAGRIKISDAILSSGFDKSEVRNGVAIDRDTHTARDKALFDSEVVPAGVKFCFRLIAENLEKNEAELLGKLMEYFAEGNITVGGRSRAGFGEVKLKNAEVKVYLLEGDFPKEQDLKGKDLGIKEAVMLCSKS